MSRKGENIHKRKDGRWEARILTFCDGQKKYKSIYGRTYKETKNKMLSYHYTNSETEEVIVTPSRDTSMMNVKNSGSLAEGEIVGNSHTFSDVTKEWFHANRLHLKESTMLKYHTLFDCHILPRFADINIADIDVQDINAFLTEKVTGGSIIKNPNTNKSKPLCSSYVRTMSILINSVINFAMRMGYRNALRAPMSKPSENKKAIGVINKSDLEKLESALNIDYSGTSIGIMLALYAGLRIGEVCALRWDDIDLKEQIIHVKHTISRIRNFTEGESTNAPKTKLIIDMPKTKSSVRDIPINSKLSAFLIRARKEAGSEYVVSDKSTFLSPRTFEYRFHRLLKKCKTKDVNFHVLRHTFSTRCVELNIDIKSLSEVLGHANVSTTLSIYVHSSMEHKRTQLEKLVM